MAAQWPERFACFCDNGQQWWNREQKAYRCNAADCNKAMTEDLADGMIGVWDGRAPAAPKLSREQAWARAPVGTTEIDLG